MAPQVQAPSRSTLPCKRLMAAQGRSSALACCGCAAQGQGRGADSCTGAEITMDLEPAQSWCHTLQDLHVMPSKPRLLLLLTVPHSWLSFPNKTCTQPELADAQHWFAVCVQIRPAHAVAGRHRHGHFKPLRLSDQLHVIPFYLWRFTSMAGTLVSLAQHSFLNIDERKQQQL